MPITFFFILLLFSFIATYVVTRNALNYANKTGLLDHPCERSSHTVSTPRGGGISVVLVFLLSIVYLRYFTPNLDNHLFISFFSGGLIVAAIGLWDDHSSVPAKLRLSTHFTAAIISLFFIADYPDIPLFDNIIKLSIFGYFFYTIFLVWMLNLYNFMDGIDGIASVEAITTLLGIIIIFYLQGDTNSPRVLMSLVACVAGFLIWNWPPVKIFMGDACSGFLGFTIGLMVITTSNSEHVNIWSWLILLSVFIVDATYTLFSRVLRGYSWFSPHRSHAYQIISRHYNSHKKVTLGVLAINVFWLFPLTYLATFFEYWAPVFGLIAILPLVLITYKVGAGLKNE